MARNGYGHMVLDYYVERLRDMREKRRKILDGIKTREDAERYREYVRSVIDKAFVKPEKVALEPVVTGRVQCEGYRIEKVRITSRPGIWVTMSLYIPDGLAGKAPGVIATCGHALEGKGCVTYQEFAIRLARNGFIVLMVDPFQQGERDQYVNLKELGMAQGLCNAHNMMGKQLDLLDDSFGSWRVWDNRCALDYLLSRPEVDAAHIGITGNSGGGTLTEWTFANDDRFTMAAPSCHVTSFLTNLENELPTDAEQCPTGVIGAGLEMVDLLFAQAPKPVKLLGQKYDFFERRGLQEAYEDLKKFYEHFGAGDKVELFIGPTQHGYSFHNQEAMVDFFRRQCGMAGEQLKIEPKTQTSEALFVLPEGNVVKAGSRPIYELVGDMARDAAAKRRVPATLAEWKAMVTNLLQLPERKGVPHFRIPRAYVDADKNVWSRYAIETEKYGVRAILKKRLVDNCAQTLDVEEDVHVFLPNFSTETDAATNDWVKGLNPGGALYAIDARGIGESMMEEERDNGFLQGYGTDFMMYCFGTMFGESYFGRRVYDVLRTLDLLVAEGAKTIHLHGLGMGALLALYSALLHDNVMSVEEHSSWETYESWITSSVIDLPSSSVVRGVLNHFDLPDLRNAVKAAFAERVAR
ncbi:MAG: prolyl oligopeptidase family serine peptidase [Victivallales bacterium]|nr:prolyl oligopeptidase family serine peptidase [Victivallales bacterium]